MSTSPSHALSVQESILEDSGPRFLPIAPRDHALLRLPRLASAQSRPGRWRLNLLACLLRLCNDQPLAFSRIFAILV